MARKQLLFLAKLPPPYGGGEVWHEILGRHLGGRADVVVMDQRRAARSKEEQGRLSAKAVGVAVMQWFRVAVAAVRHRPRKILLSLPLHAAPFLRDWALVLPFKLVGAVVYGEVHGESLWFLERSDVLSRVASWGLGAIDELRVLGRESKRRLGSRLAGRKVPRIVAIPNGVEGPSRRVRVPLAQRESRMLFIGSIGGGKGFFDLLRAMQRLRKQGSAVTLEVLGDWASPSERRRVEEFLGRHDLREYVAFRGVVTGERKWEALARARAVILPSYSEGLPLVLLESLAVGTPIVTTRVGDIPDIFEAGEVGMLVDPGDVDALAEGMVRVLDDRTWEEWSRNCIAVWEREYSVVRAVGRMKNWLGLSEAKSTRE